jgi:hypothetical protein
LNAIIPAASRAAPPRTGMIIRTIPTPLAFSAVISFSLASRLKA